MWKDCTVQYKGWEMASVPKKARVCYISYQLPGYDKKSDEGSNSVRMRPENSGASKVVEN